MEVSSYSLTSELHAQIHSKIELAKLNNPLAQVVLVVDSPLHGLLLRRQLVESFPSQGIANIQVETVENVIRDINSRLGLPEIIFPTDSALDAASYAAMLANKTLASSDSESLSTAIEISSVYKKLRYNTELELRHLIAADLSDTQKSVIESVLSVRKVLYEKLEIPIFSESVQRVISELDQNDFKSQQTYLVLTSTLPKLARTFFEKLGASTRFVVNETNEKISQVEKYVTAPDPQTEVKFAVARIAEYAKSGVHPYDVAVVYSDLQQYGRLLATALDDAKIAWHGAVETVSQTSALYLGFDLILQMLERRSPTSSGAERPLVMRLLESGDFYVDGMLLDAGLCRKFVRDKELYGDSVKWLKVLKTVVSPGNKRDEKSADELKALLKFLGHSLERLDSATNWTEFGQELFAVIEEFYLGVNEENLSEDEKKVALRFKKTLLEELPEIDSLTPVGITGLNPTAKSVRSFLSRKIGEKKVRRGSLSIGVHVSGIDEVRILNFKKLILVGATEGFLPKPVSESPFLTDRMLSEIGEIGQGSIATVEASKVLGANLLAILADKFPIVTRSRAAMIGKLDDVPSRFLDVKAFQPKFLEIRSYNQLLKNQDLGGVVSEEDLKLILRGSSEDSLSPDQKGIAEALKVFRNPAQTNYFGVVEDFSEELSVSKRFLSASSIEGFMDCEYKFFVTKILGIYAADREDELQIWRAKDFGNLIHNSMEAFLNELAEQDALPDGKTAFTENQVEQYFSKYLAAGLEEFYAKGHDAWRAGFESLMNRVERNLRHFFSTEFDAIRSPLELGVYASELPFGHEPKESDRVMIDIPGRKSVQLAGRIDRVDLSADKKSAGVLDFKSGKYSSDIPGDLGRPKRSGANKGLSMRTKVQDLVYLLAVRKRYPQVEKVQVNFAYIATGTQSNFVNAQWLDEPERQLGEIIERIYLDQDSGVFPISHKAAIGESTYCDVCKRLDWVAEQLRKNYSQAAGFTELEGSND